MGEIVAAFGTVHAPQLIIRPPDENPAMLDAASRPCVAWKDPDETKPDAIVFLKGSPETFSMACIPTFAIIEEDGRLRNSRAETMRCQSIRRWPKIFSTS